MTAHRVRLALFAVVGCFIGGALACAGTEPTSDQARQFTILQINDVYKIEGIEAGTKGGLGRVRTLRAKLEAEGPVVVLLAGDVLFPSVMSKYLEARPIVDILNILDGDPDAFDDSLILTFGNHEFDSKDSNVILERVAESEFSWVSSNVLFRDENGRDESVPRAFFADRMPNIHERIVHDIGGVKLGIFGLTLDSERKKYVGYVYSDKALLSALIRESIDALRSDGAEVIVALTHQNMVEDVWMAETFPDINFVVGGHEHFQQMREVEPPTTVTSSPLDPVWITKADSDAVSAVVIRVEVDAMGHVTSTRKIENLHSDTPVDPKLGEAVSIWEEELGTKIREVKGEDAYKVYAMTANLLEGVEPAVRGRETALGNFLTDVIRERTGADIAFINGGAIRINDNIPAGGKIRGIDLEGIFYFDNKIVTFELTGQQLLELLRKSVSGVHLGHGRFLQVSGLRFRYHSMLDDDDIVYSVAREDVEVQGQLLDLERHYSASTLDYVWKYGFLDGYELFSLGNKEGGTSPERTDDPEDPHDWRQTTVKALQALPPGKPCTKMSDVVDPKSKVGTVCTGIEHRIEHVDSGPKR